jgi:hypothetical protein
MRPVGTRDCPELYPRILALLKKNPQGLNAEVIGKMLKANVSTIRVTYLPDLIKQGKVETEKEEGKRRVYLIVTTDQTPNVKT